MIPRSLKAGSLRVLPRQNWKQPLVHTQCAHKLKVQYCTLLGNCFGTSWWFTVKSPLWAARRMRSTVSGGGGYKWGRTAPAQGGDCSQHGVFSVLGILELQLQKSSGLNTALHSLFLKLFGSSGFWEPHHQCIPSEPHLPVASSRAWSPTGQKEARAGVPFRLLPTSHKSRTALPGAAAKHLCEAVKVQQSPIKKGNKPSLCLPSKSLLLKQHEALGWDLPESYRILSSFPPRFRLHLHHKWFREQ